MGNGRGSLRLLVAAGGTGGHLYPALAVARKLLMCDREAEVVFTGTRRGLEGQIVPRAGFALELVRAEPLRGGSLARKLKGLVMLPLALADAFRVLRRIRPSVVMGVGGYVSGPLLAVAALTGVPTLIIEPNATPGLANRWLSPLVDAAALGWEEVATHFGGKGFVSGNPVREEITRVKPRPPDRHLHLLVFGGSQGSRVLNQAMVEALAHLAGRRDRLRVTHQTGELELAAVKAAYERAEFRARVEPYLDAMASEYEVSDLVVSRAGAMTCAELAAAGRPSILIPLPLAAGHQIANATMMQRQGAAEVILESQLTGERLARAISNLLESPERRQEMADRARRLARPDAASVIVDRLRALARREQQP